MSTRINVRGWAFIDEDAAPDLDTPQGRALTARLDALMLEWSTIHAETERKYFDAQSAREDGLDWGYDPRSCECGDTPADPDDLCSHDRAALDQIDAATRLEAASKRLRTELIEHELAAHGARHMRAYEHWNEDERYMQYMEEGRFGHYTD